MQGARPDFTLHSRGPGVLTSDSLSILIFLQLLNALLVVRDLLVVGNRLVHLLVSFLVD